MALLFLKSNGSKTGFRMTGVFMTILFWAVAVDAAEPADDWKSREIARFSAVEAKQGVAVDADFFYAIDNRRIGKYDKKDGRRVDGWNEVKGGPFIHLNAGFVKDGRLYAAHSNYPGTPMLSSVEIWDVAAMRHCGSHSFGTGPGSLTWFTERDGLRYACFANYGTKGRENEPPPVSPIVCFDEQWRSVGGHVFPPTLVRKFGTSSASGGSFGPGGFLYVTGHDAKELYVLDFPKAGSVLNWIATIPVAMEGQAFAWDPVRENILYGIVRSRKEIVVIEIQQGTLPEK